jgi:hypothetical protein
MIEWMDGPGDRQPVTGFPEYAASRRLPKPGGIRYSVLVYASPEGE